MHFVFLIIYVYFSTVALIIFDLFVLVTLILDLNLNTFD